MKSRLAMYRNSVSQPGVVGTKQGQNPKVGASMKVPPNRHECCSRTNPQKISCQNDTRLYDKGTKWLARLPAARPDREYDPLGACALSPTAPNPSRVGTPRAAVKFPSEPPPVDDSSRVTPNSAAIAFASVKSLAMALVRSIGGRFKPPSTRSRQRVS